MSNNQLIIRLDSVVRCTIPSNNNLENSGFSISAVFQGDSNNNSTAKALIFSSIKLILGCLAVKSNEKCLDSTAEYSTIQFKQYTCSSSRVRLCRESPPHPLTLTAYHGMHIIKDVLKWLVNG